VMEIDYFGTLALTKALLPGMVKRKQGHFVVVTSLMGLFSSPLRSGYCGAKHALHGFFESLRAEHHDDNVKVTMVCPGFIHTNISMNAVVGDGSQQGTMDAKTGAGMSPEACAESMIRAVERNKAKRNADAVLRSLSEMGLSLDRVRLSSKTSRSARSNEVHLFVR